MASTVIFTSRGVFVFRFWGLGPCFVKLYFLRLGMRFIVLVFVTWILLLLSFLGCILGAFKLLFAVVLHCQVKFRSYLRSFWVHSSFESIMNLFQWLIVSMIMRICSWYPSLFSVKQLRCWGQKWFIIAINIIRIVLTFQWQWGWISAEFDQLLRRVRLFLSYSRGTMSLFAKECYLKLKFKSSCHQWFSKNLSSSLNIKYFQLTMNALSKKFLIKWFLCVQVQF